MDIESWPDLFTEYAKAEVTRAGRRHGSQFRLTTHPDPEYDGQVWSWVSERMADPASYTSKSQRIETGPFEFMNIEWYFEEADEGTKHALGPGLLMKPDAPADDETAQEYMNRTPRSRWASSRSGSRERCGGGNER